MDELKEILSEVSIVNIESHIKNLEGIRHPQISPDALAAAADYISDVLNSLGLEMTPHHFYEHGEEFTNIIGFQRGIRHPEKKVVVMAHYDSVRMSPGADDNASGVAAMLELARVLNQCTFSRSILYTAVNLEESKDFGEDPTLILRGSRALAGYARERGWEIEGVLNFETIAYAGETLAQTAPEMMPIELPEVGNFIAVIGNENSLEMVEDYITAIKQYQIPLPYYPIVVPGNGELLADTRRSDHAAFWDQDYRAIMLTDTANFRSPYYHQPGDTLETLNLTFAAEVCRAGGGLVCKMAGFISSL